MREIEFRGKRIGNGEWLVSKTVVRADGGFFLALPDAEVYGDYGNKEGVTHLCCNRGFLAEVSPETVGQYTGLKDKNGKKIYEGDVISTSDGEYIVKWDEEEAQLVMISTGPGTSIVKEFNWFDAAHGEVIGNIHDNPELVEADL